MSSYYITEDGSFLTAHWWRKDQFFSASLEIKSWCDNRSGWLAKWLSAVRQFFPSFIWKNNRKNVSCTKETYCSRQNKWPFGWKTIVQCYLRGRNNRLNFNTRATRWLKENQPEGLFRPVDEQNKFSFISSFTSLVYFTHGFSRSSIFSPQINSINIHHFHCCVVYFRDFAPSSWYNSVVGGPPQTAWTYQNSMVNSWDAGHSGFESPFPWHFPFIKFLELRWKRENKSGYSLVSVFFSYILSFMLLWLAAWGFSICFLLLTFSTTSFCFSYWR